MISNYESIWKAFIRPARQTYSEVDLGPHRGSFQGVSWKRVDVEVVNRSGKILKTSLFFPVAHDASNNQYDCVVYCHGNSGCRLDGITYLQHFISKGIGLCCFDFNGSGMTEGEYVSLGFHEQHDLKSIVDHLRTIPRIRSLALLGRSMGAVTALLYASVDSNFSGIIADSPFSNLKELALELAETKASSLPKFLLEAMLGFVNNSIQERAGFRLDQIDLTEAITRVKAPVMFVASPDDRLVNITHSRKLRSLCGSSSAEFHLVSGEHNAERTDEYKQYITDYFKSIFAKTAEEKRLRSIDEQKENCEEQRASPHKLIRTLISNSIKKPLTTATVTAPASVHQRHASGGVILPRTTLNYLDVKRVPSQSTHIGGSSSSCILTEHPPLKMPAKQQIEETKIQHQSQYGSAPQLKKLPTMPLNQSSTTDVSSTLPSFISQASHYQVDNVSFLHHYTSSISVPRNQQEQRNTSQHLPLQAIQENIFQKPSFEVNRSEKKHQPPQPPQQQSKEVLHTQQQKGGGVIARDTSTHIKESAGRLYPQTQLQQQNYLMQPQTRQSTSLHSVSQPLLEQSRRIPELASSSLLQHAPSSQSQSSIQKSEIHDQSKDNYTLMDDQCSTGLLTLIDSDSSSSQARVKGIRKYSIEPAKKLSPKKRAIGSSRYSASTSLHYSSGRDGIHDEGIMLTSPTFPKTPNTQAAINCTSCSFYHIDARKAAAVAEAASQRHIARSTTEGALAQPQLNQLDSSDDARLSTLFSINDEFQEADDEMKCLFEENSTEQKQLTEEVSNRRTTSNGFSQQQQLATTLANLPDISSGLHQRHNSSQITSSKQCTSLLPLAKSNTHHSRSVTLHNPAITSTSDIGQRLSSEISYTSTTNPIGLLKTTEEAIGSYFIQQVNSSSSSSSSNNNNNNINNLTKVVDKTFVKATTTAASATAAQLVREPVLFIHQTSINLTQSDPSMREENFKANAYLRVISGGTSSSSSEAQRRQVIASSNVSLHGRILINQSEKRSLEDSINYQRTSVLDSGRKSTDYQSSSESSDRNLSSAYDQLPLSSRVGSMDGSSNFSSSTFISHAKQLSVPSYEPIMRADVSKPGSHHRIHSEHISSQAYTQNGGSIIKRPEPVQQQLMETPSGYNRNVTQQATASEIIKPVAYQTGSGSQQMESFEKWRLQYIAKKSTEAAGKGLEGSMQDLSSQSLNPALQLSAPHKNLSHQKQQYSKQASEAVYVSSFTTPNQLKERQVNQQAQSVGGGGKCQLSYSAAAPGKPAFQKRLNLDGVVPQPPSQQLTQENSKNNNQRYFQMASVIKNRINQGKLISDYAIKRVGPTSNSGSSSTAQGQIRSTTTFIAANKAPAAMTATVQHHNVRSAIGLF